MRFAYLINAHKNAKQVLRLIDKLNNDRTDFVIHVSKSCEGDFWKDIRKNTASYGNVYFCKRERSIHNGFAIVQATINGMETLLKIGSKFDYLHLLSGQDYPIKKNEEIFEFFEKHSGKEFMYFWKMFPKEGEADFVNHPWGENRQAYRVNRFCFPWLGETFIIPELLSRRLLDKTLYQTVKIFLFEFKKYWKLGTVKDEFSRLVFSRVLPRERDHQVDFDFYGGKTWFSFTRKLIQYIINEHNNSVKWKKFYKYSLIPDEMYFHSITMNSKFAANVENDYLREVEWEGGDGSHPVIWTKDDFQRLHSTKNFWARKFEDQIDSEILDLIDAKLLHSKD
jgi:hypothetical protein